MKNVELSIIAPVYNEEKYVEKVIEDLCSTNYNVSFEIIIVNDGSTDKTSQKLKKIKIRAPSIKIIEYKKNMGKGYAIRRGLEYARGNVITIQDVDLEYNPKEIPNLFKQMKNNKANVVYGYRSFKKMKKSYKIGNILLTKLTNELFHGNLKDMETCYKMMNRKIFISLNLKSNGFEIEPEITAKLLKNRYTILEVPVSYNPRDINEGKKITAKHGIISLITLLGLRSRIFNWIFRLLNFYIRIIFLYRQKFLQV